MSSPIRSLRAGTERWFLWLLILFGLLVLRLIHIQVLRHRHYASAARQIQLRKFMLFAERGTIFDRNGTKLAVSAMRRTVFGDPSLVRHPRGAADILAPLLHLDPAEVAGKLARRRDEHGRKICYVVLKRRVADATATRIMALLKPRRDPKSRRLISGLPGIGLQLEPQRQYPKGMLAAHTIGFVGDGDQGPVGRGGLEASLGRVLAGRNGYLEAEIDRHGGIIPGRRLEERPAVNGRDLVLSLDANLQQIAETQLRAAVEENGARGGTIAIINPRSGDLLALANEPAFDPNRYREYPSETWRNSAITCCYEPGSTFKLVAVSAAVEEGVVRPDDPIDCPGAMIIGSHTIHCAHGAHGHLTVAGVIEKSCNIGAAKIALKLGPEKFFRYLRRYGFGRAPKLGMGAEATGHVSADWRNWKDIQLANMAFGQSISVTPIQLLTAYCAIANDGKLPRVHLVERIAGEPQGSLHHQPRPVVSLKTARIMRSMLEQVVSTGTGKAAQIDGYRIAGKTGTAQKPVPGVGFRSGKFIGSFLGFVPADDPRLAIIVVIDEPTGSHYGAVVAAPAFRQVALQALSYLNVPPTAVAQAR